MAVNTAEIASTYETLLSSITTSVGGMWTRNEIDAETYAGIISKASVDLINVSADLVQKQEQIDKDLDIKERQMLETEATGTKQRSKLDEEIDLLQSQDTELIANGLVERDTKARQILEAEAVGAHKRSVLDVQDLKESQSRIDTGILNTQLQGWSGAFNGGKVDNVPKLVTNAEIADTYAHVSSHIPIAGV